MQPLAPPAGDGRRDGGGDAGLGGDGQPGGQRPVPPTSARGPRRPAGRRRTRTPSPPETKPDAPRPATMPHQHSRGRSRRRRHHPAGGRATVPAPSPAITGSAWERKASSGTAWVSGSAATRGSAGTAAERDAVHRDQRPGADGEAGPGGQPDYRGGSVRQQQQPGRPGRAAPAAGPPERAGEGRGDVRRRPAATATTAVHGASAVSSPASTPRSSGPGAPGEAVERGGQQAGFPADPQPPATRGRGRTHQLPSAAGRPRVRGRRARARAPR